MYLWPGHEHAISGMVHIVMVEDLVRASKAGDRRAHDELGFWINRRLRAFFGQRFDDFAASELVQEASLDILAKLHKFEDRGPGSFLKWVTKTASLEALASTREERRQLARDQKVRDLPPKTPPTTPGSALDRETRKRVVHWCLPQLPEQERQAIQHELDGGNDEELAAKENIAVTTVRGRRRRARLRMRGLLDPFDL